ncbi:MAG: hypothetical protein WA996_00975 [Candidatus Promineifilaceae bacterium]
MTNGGKWLGSILIVAISAMGGILCYLLWMVIAIPATRAGNDLIATTLWILAPFLTALGFAIGATIAERRFRGGGNSFIRIYIWPLVGCAIGALSTYVFGPMLIVFGMLSLGTVSIALREIWNLFRKSNMG